MEGAIGDNKVAVLCRAIFDEVVPEFSEVEISELGFGLALVVENEVELFVEGAADALVVQFLL